MEPKISIIIPTYNVEKYLEKTINSVIKQTIGFENLELIIVDDNSSDNTQKIIETYSKKYDNIVPIYRNENSGGPGIPRNIGMKKVTSEFIMFLDGDDTYKSDVCETVYETIKSKDLDFVWFRVQSDDNIVFGNHIVLDNLETKKGIFKYTPKKIRHDEEFLNIMMSGECVWDKIFKKEFLIKNNIEFEDCLSEDIYFMSLVFTKSVKWVLLNNYIGYNYLIRENSIIHSSSKKNVEMTLKAINLTYEYLKKENDSLINYGLHNLTGIVRYNLNCKMKLSEQKEILQKYNDLFKAYKLNIRSPNLSLGTNIGFNILIKVFSSNYIIAIVL
ncbi:MAG: glycosyltransferase [Methanobrevibacter sp.]|jgi:glycosyltransferase involved in cell wall biosynthesis|nr:glycosyltransferase [Methanobrevibacter sp.]